MTDIFIDADACPVKDETIRVAQRHNCKVYIVSNGGLRPNPHPLVKNIIVADGADIADMWIVDHTKKGDIVITADIPLAAKCLMAGARVLRHNGDCFTQSNIGNQLATRDLMADIRASDPFFKGSGRPFSKTDRSKFLNNLEREVRAVLKE